MDVKMPQSGAAMTGTEMSAQPGAVEVPISTTPDMGAGAPAPDAVGADQTVAAPAEAPQKPDLNVIPNSPAPVPDVLAQTEQPAGSGQVPTAEAAIDSGAHTDLEAIVGAAPVVQTPETEKNLGTVSATDVVGDTAPEPVIAADQTVSPTTPPENAPVVDAQTAVEPELAAPSVEQQSKAIDLGPYIAAREEERNAGRKADEALEGALGAIGQDNANEIGNQKAA